MNTLPQAESAKQAQVIDIATRQPMEPGTQQAPRVNSRWHKTPNRMADPAYLALPLIARAALAAFDELCASGPVIGTRSRLCVLIGAEPKHARFALDPLRESGFIVVEETADQWIVNTPATTVQHIANASPTHRQPCSNGKQQSANDAGLPPHSLNKSKSKSSTNVEQNNRDNNPLDPPARKRAIGSPEFEAFWRDYPNKGPKPEALAQWQAIDPDADTVTAIMAGLTKAKASQRWADGYVVQACRFLRDERWSDDWPPAAVSRGELQATKDEFASMFGTF